MAASNRDRVGRALDLLKEGLRPVVEREFEIRYGQGWPAEAMQVLRLDREWQSRGGATNLDVAALFNLMWSRWDEVFARTLGRTERNLVAELRDARNRWAHQEAFSGDDAYRVLDSADRLLSAVSAAPAGE